MSKEQFDKLLKDVGRDFEYVRDQNDCSDFVRRVAERAPEYGLQLTVRVFDTDRGRHAAVEYWDESGERWMGDVIYKQPVQRDLYKRRLGVVW